MTLSEDEVPLAKIPVKSEESDDDLPLARKRKSSTAPKKEKKPRINKSKVNGKKAKDSQSLVKDELDNEKDRIKSLDSTSLNRTSLRPKSLESDLTKSLDSLKSASPDGDTYKWWEEEDLDGEIKWNSLEHNGVMFPPEYEPLPLHVKLLYDGKPVNLPIEAEEVAGFYGAMLETDHAKNPVFQRNFFEDFLVVLQECRDRGATCPDIREFEKCDFSRIYAHYEKLKEDRKLMTRDEKKRIKAEKDALEEPFKNCMLNGHKEMVGNFRIEPPGLFRGRGAHPKTGKLKRRVFPEDITLNISAEAKIPEPPAGHSWREVRHDNTVTWLAMWKENIADSTKYVRFAANSSIKGQSDFKKFETARKLKMHIADIRRDYEKMLKSEVMFDRQMATATYLIDIFALRAGGEKGEDEADTVGCCSLRYEHITLKPPNTVIFDFLGKDSIRFYQEVEVAPQVFKNLRIFKKLPKQPGDDLFDRINPALLNKKFQGYMKGLTAKVFRTYNASKTMQDQLDLIENTGTVSEKVVKFNAANRTVAILCNHQRTVSKTHESTVARIGDRLKELVWQKIRTKRMMLQIDPSLAKDKKYFGEIKDLTKEDEQQIHEQVITRAREQLEKKVARDNEKLKLEGKPPLSAEEIGERRAKVDDLEAEYREELRLGLPEVKKGMTVEKLKLQVETIENRIVNTSMQLKDKEDNSEVSLGTSKLNYIDPRLTVMFSKKFDVPIERLFTKTLRDKFKWAIESADENWRF